MTTSTQTQDTPSSRERLGKTQAFIAGSYGIARNAIFAALGACTLDGVKDLAAGCVTLVGGISHETFSRINNVNLSPRAFAELAAIGTVGHLLHLTAQDKEINFSPSQRGSIIASLTGAVLTTAAITGPHFFFEQPTQSSINTKCVPTAPVSSVEPALPILRAKVQQATVYKI